MSKSGAVNKGRERSRKRVRRKYWAKALCNRQTMKALMAVGQALEKIFQLLFEIIRAFRGN
jgi:hypothetical protein